VIALVWLRVLIVAAAVAAAWAAIAGFIHHERDIGRQEVRAEWALDREKQKDAAIAQATANAQETQRRLAAQKEIQDAHDKDLARARADAAGAAVAAGRLRSQIAVYTAAARRAAGNPAAAGDSTPAGDPIGVLADVLGRADKRAGILATYADAARAAGLQCERSYETLSPAP